MCVSRVIAHNGEEVFKHSNTSKIIETFNKPKYKNSYIIIDETSMIDRKSYDIIKHINVPIIFIGDYCQFIDDYW